MHAHSKKSVHIRISDTGWILERLAREIADRLPYVTYDTYTNAEADIQYYMTYGCWQHRVSPIELALFTHKEEIPAAAAKFELVSREMDYCIAQSITTEQILCSDGIEKVETISPGVDLERFKPLVRIGVVGRTYHTGRKGEALVASVIDLPGIEWHFTGAGWPGPASHVAEEDMPAFYRSLDYVLVPSLIEGGPMCVLEALACGCKVIGSPVGWVPQFPHIGFNLGDATDLRRVLTDIVEEKAALRRSVEGYTWEAWAQNHHRLFTRLLGCDPMIDAEHAEGVDLLSSDAGLKAVVAVHGTEMSSSLGGPSVRAPRTAAALRRIGVAAEFKATRNFPVSDVDVVHVLNVWQPSTCEVLLRQIEKNNRPVVLSPIFLDLSERKFFNGSVLEILSQDLDDSQVVHSLAALREELQLNKLADESVREPIPGYFSKVRRLTTYADHLILLSNHELQLLREIGIDHPSSSLVKNPVESELFANGDPALFCDKFGVTDYVLCVGRIESRKNQALLAFALRGTEIPLVFVGHDGDAAYVNLVRKWAGENTLFAGRIEPNSPMLASALAGARVFCLPSWSEGAPLVALEAAAAGCNMVLSNRSSEEEYFGDLARYADPADPEDIRAKILAAYEENRPASKAKKLQKLMRTEHSWDTYARTTLEAYRSAQSQHAMRQLAGGEASSLTGRVFIDLTTLAHHKGTPTGMARVEERITSALADLDSTSVYFVFWDSQLNRFIPLNREVVQSHMVKNIRESGIERLLTNRDNQTCFGEVNFTPEDHLVILGSAWMRNKRYLRAVQEVKWATGARLTIAIYDVIQWKFKLWYPIDTGTEFSENCLDIASIADQVLTCSECTKKDLEEFLAGNNVAIPPVKTFRLGDEAANFGGFEQIQSTEIQQFKGGQKFILFVSTLDYRKNHRLLFDLWRRLLSEHGAAVPYLVLVGSVGWRGEETVSQLQADATLQQKVILLQNINDCTLEWLYKNCLFTVYPSLYEGWGMPVAESLRHGKFCIASNGGSLPEVAPGFVEYIDPLDYMGWYQALVKYILSPALLESRSQSVMEYQLTHWSDTAEFVLAAVRECRVMDRLPPLLSEIPINFCKNPIPSTQHASEFVMGGWGRFEDNGTWTIGTHAVLGFQLDRQPTAFSKLEITAFGYEVEPDPVEVVILANGVTLTRWSVGKSEAGFFALIPPGLIDTSRSLRIEFNIINPKRPRDYDSDSKDSRLLGLRVKTITLAEIDEIIEFDPNQWLNMPSRQVSEWVLRSTNAWPEPKYIAMEWEVGGASELTVALNGKDIGTYASGRCPVGQMAMSCAYGNFDIEDTFCIAVKADSDSMHRITRLGFFDNPPKEILTRAMQSHSPRVAKKAVSGPCHVQFAGSAPKIAFGAPVLFQKGAPVLRGLVGGWHAPEQNGIWTNGSPATIHLDLYGQSGDLLVLDLEYDCYGLLLQAGAEFSISIGACTPVSLVQYTGSQSFAQVSAFKKEIIVSTAEALDPQGRLHLTLRSTGAIAPCDVGESEDNRPLAIFIRSLSIYSPTALVDLFWDVPQLVNDQLQPAEAFTGGWLEPEPDGFWSNGKASSIAIRLPGIPTEPITLSLDLSTIPGICEGGPQRIQVLADYLPAAIVELTEDGIQSKAIVIALEHLPFNSADLMLTLSCDNSARPSDLFDSGDCRDLSFKLHKITLLSTTTDILSGDRTEPANDSGIRPQKTKPKQNRKRKKL